LLIKWHKEPMKNLYRKVFITNIKKKEEIFITNIKKSIDVSMLENIHNIRKGICYMKSEVIKAGN